MRFAALLLALCASVFAADPIKAAEAKDHIGQTATVCGKVADTRYLDESGRRPTFLNFDAKYPNHVFTAVIFGDDRAKFGTPEKDYLNKSICVTGKIEEFNKKPQVVLTAPEQVKADSK